jgi:Aspartate-semialdehyde dehydrogenase
LPDLKETTVTNDPVVAIVGVTGAVGAEFIATMDKRNFRVGKLKALASARSAGKTVDFRGERILIEELTPHAFHGVDIALFSAGGSISKKYAPIAVKSGAVVVDNSPRSGWIRTCRWSFPRSTPAASAITRASSPTRIARR